MKVTQQNGTATGVVKDALGEVIGASVVVKGTTNGVVTDFEGRFSLNGVKKGDILVILEAMKMENEITAPRDGVVSQIVATKGAAVDTGAALVVLA